MNGRKRTCLPPWLGGFHPGDSVVQVDIGGGKILRLADEFRVDLDRAVGELRMAFGHDAVML